MRKHAAPIIAAVLLLFPMLYAGSYLALVWPDKERLDMADSRGGVPTYRYGTETWAWRVYWPLEQIDRHVRPAAWTAWSRGGHGD